MQEISFRETQLVMVDILKKIDCICQKEKINYSLFYGTLIGAIRHKGVIPWDDDADIAMPRKDYDRLLKYFEENKAELLPYKLFTIYNTKKYPYMIARISNMNYTICTQNEENCGMGVFVDIYPFDGMGNDFNSARKLARKADAFSSMCFLSTRLHYATDNTKYKLKMFLKFPAYILARIIGKNFWFRALERLSNIYSYDDSKYVGCVRWFDGNDNEIYEKSWFENTIRVPFEGYMLNVPQQYDKVLRHYYGDYMKVPDEAGRAVHHHYKTYKIEDNDKN